MTVLLQDGLDVSEEITDADGNPVGPLVAFDNAIEDFNFFSDTAVDGLPISNCGNPATHLFWQSETVDATENIYMGAFATPMNYIAIAGHNFGSAEIGIMLSEITNDSPFTTVPIIFDGASPAGFIPIADDSPIIMRFDQRVYNNLLITLDVGSTSPRAAVIFGGSILVFERGVKVDVTHTPIDYGRSTRVVNGMSESGNFLGRVVLSESRQTKAEFFGITDGFMRDVIKPFGMFEAMTEAPFFFAWAPFDYPEDVGYCWLTEDAVPEQSPDPTRIWSLTLNMAGVAP